MRRYFTIFCIALRNNINARLAYRADAILTMVMNFIGGLLIPFVTLLIYSNGVGFADWSMHEVLLVQGVFTVTTGIAYMFFLGVMDSTLSLVVEGTYDILLIKPVSTLFMSFASYFSLTSIGTVINGVVVIIYAMTGIESQPRIGLFLLLMVMGLSVLVGLFLLMAGTAFKWVGNSRLYEIFNAVVDFGQYPATIYSPVLRVVLTYIIPIALIGYYPATALLGEPVTNLLPLALVCVLFLVVGGLFWKFMLRLYTSAGG